MTTVEINWATVIAAVTAIAGVAGSILTPVFGTHLATQVQVVLQAIAGLLVLIPAHHATSTVAAASRERKIARIHAEYNPAAAPLPTAHVA